MLLLSFTLQYYIQFLCLSISFEVKNGKKDHFFCFINQMISVIITAEGHLGLLFALRVQFAGSVFT